MPRTPKAVRALAQPNGSQRLVEAPNVPPKPLTFPALRARLSYHWDTLPPTEEQLKHAKVFFDRRPPKFLWSAENFKTMPFGSSPEVCFLGRSNVGKSSLLNAVLNKRIAFASAKPGRTKLMNAFAVGGEDRGWPLVVLDMPGYGHGGRAAWGTQIMKYLETRTELKRAFLLVDSEHGIKQTDAEILAMFRRRGIPYQVILSKVDRLMQLSSKNPGPQAMEQKLDTLEARMRRTKEMIQPDPEEDEGLAVGEIVSCSTLRRIAGKEVLGINAVRFAILRAAGLEMKPRVTLSQPDEIIPFEALGMR